MMNLLVPTDFSYTSKHSIKQFLKDFGKLIGSVNITLVNAYELTNVDVGNAVILNDNMKSLSKKKLEQLKEEILTEAERLQPNFTLISHIGSIENVIKEVLNSGNYNLIIMGKNGGSYIEKVSKVLNGIHSKCPLIIMYPPGRNQSSESENQLA